MFRSLSAVVAAVFVGLAAAKLIEMIGAGATDGSRASLAYQLILILSWAVAAAAATATALKLGRNWAPLGWLAAGSVLVNIFAILVETALHPLTALIGAAVAGGAGYGVIKLMKASVVDPSQHAARRGLFDG